MKPAEVIPELDLADSGAGQRGGLANVRSMSRDTEEWDGARLKGETVCT